MTELRDILVSGKAPNDDANATTKDAKRMEQYFSALFDTLPEDTKTSVVGLVINTTAVGPTSAELIPLSEVVPQPEDGMRFYYHLQVELTSGEVQNWAVSSWVTALEIHGIYQATMSYMTKVYPAWNVLSFDPAFQGMEFGLSKYYDGL